jgi:hypothetical protein
MMQFIKVIKEWYQAWRDRRFLKKHCCNNWEQYLRQTDPDVFYPATRIRDFYHGYPYVYCFENRSHQIYQWDLGFDGSAEIVDWTKFYCQGKVRFDGFRCVKDSQGDWCTNELGGGDYYFAAFKKELDMFNFILRWA